jgi:uroporphyrinogen decarboxylase
MILACLETYRVTGEKSWYEEAERAFEWFLGRNDGRLPLYEHIISPAIMEQVLGVRFAELAAGSRADVHEFFKQYCRFFHEMTYDTVSFEMCITEILPEHGAIMGGRPGPIQTRADFQRYPWHELPARFWQRAAPHFEALSRCLPPGMKAVGGVGNGAFEISEDLVGFEYLAYLMVDDPGLFDELYRRIGDLMVEIWTEFLARYGHSFAVCRFGDDLGFKTSTLLSHRTIREKIIPQYRRVIDLVHASGHPFLWHSCGCIFGVMDDVLAIGIDAKHSNEDVIAPFDRWIALYGDRIGLLGGIDVDLLCTQPADVIFEQVVERGQRFRKQARGYALGSGNSIPDYVPVEGYLAMIRAAQEIRRLVSCCGR